MKPYNNAPLILAIESSCDETSAAVMKNGQVLSNVIASQKIHEEYGGVVPELASRAHEQNIIPVVWKAINDAKIEKKDLDAVAFTRGPGLLGALLVGTSFAKSFAFALDIPLIEVNHIHAHVLSHFIEDPKPSLPFLCLTVSGGHTQLVRVDEEFQIEILGQTLDDAAGEAFDKSAKMLGLPYPGGPLIDQYAKDGDPKKFAFPPAQTEGLDFSFSGFKTSVLYFLQKKTSENPNFISENLNDLCASIQYRIVKNLTDKLIKAQEITGIQEIALAGGVAANSGLRESLKKIAAEKGLNLYIPKFEYCTDNAAMIAVAAHFKYLRKEFAPMNIAPSARI
jgi:N6-L-threonylcarbamoyladenine synthase